MCLSTRFTVLLGFWYIFFFIFSAALLLLKRKQKGEKPLSVKFKHWLLDDRALLKANCSKSRPS